jgi:hypothetical protein
VKQATGLLLALTVLAAVTACQPGQAAFPTCAGVSVRDVVFRGDSASRRIWFDSPEARFEIVGLTRYRAEFGPLARILDADGAVIAEDGARLREVGLCVRGDGRYDLWNITV